MSLALPQRCLGALRAAARRVASEVHPRRPGPHVTHAHRAATTHLTHPRSTRQGSVHRANRDPTARQPPRKAARIAMAVALEGAAAKSCWRAS
jgi:hypothetical protein